MQTPNRHPHPNEHAYAFTASQLDAFQAFLDAEYDWGQWWGNSDEPAKTVEEYAAECEKNLIDQINRCPKEPIEAADKGTCFNEVVDMIIHNLAPVETRSDMDIRLSESEPFYIFVKFNGFEWCFDTHLCTKVAERYPYAISQYLVGAPLQTAKGLVWLYGYPDEWCGDKISDIKTTKEYHFGKYSRKWQKHVYPYAVVESGDCTEIKEFEYTAVKLSEPTKKDPVIHGEIYPEVYTNDHEQNRRLLQDVCERFIGWLEYRRGFITDNKIWGGINAPDYIGKPIDVNLLIQ